MKCPLCLGPCESLKAWNGMTVYGCRCVPIGTTWLVGPLDEAYKRLEKLCRTVNHDPGDEGQS